MITLAVEYSCHDCGTTELLPMGEIGIEAHGSEIRLYFRSYNFHRVKISSRDRLWIFDLIRDINVNTGLEPMKFVLLPAWAPGVRRSVVKCGRCNPVFRGLNGEVIDVRNNPRRKPKAR